MTISSDCHNTQYIKHTQQFISINFCYFRYFRLIFPLVTYCSLHFYSLNREEIQVADIKLLTYF